MGVNESARQPGSNDTDPVGYLDRRSDPRYNTSHKKQF